MCVCQYMFRPPLMCMEDVTIILTVAALLMYVLTLKMQGRVPSMLALTLSVCAMSAVFQDTSIGNSQTYLIAFPLIVTALFSIGQLCVVKK